MESCIHSYLFKIKYALICHSCYFVTLKKKYYREFSFRENGNFLLLYKSSKKWIAYVEERIKTSDHKTSNSSTFHKSYISQHLHYSTNIVYKCTVFYCIKKYPFKKFSIILKFWKQRKDEPKIIVKFNRVWSRKYGNFKNTTSKTSSIFHLFLHIQLTG